MQVYYDEQLYHYGIKGMKWGVIKKEDITSSSRTKHNTPTSKRELKAEKFEDKANNANSERRKKFYEREAERARNGKLSHRQRQVLVGASIVAAYATYKFVDSGEAHRLITTGKAILNKEDPINKWVKNEAFANKHWDAQTAFNEVALNINPYYGVEPGTTMNCRRCTFAYIKAREGFDVEATRSFTATGQNDISVYNAISGNKWVKGGRLGAGREIRKGNQDFIDFLSSNKPHLNAKINLGDDSNKTAEKIFEALSTKPNNARGELTMNWHAGGGHSMAWEIFNGKPVIFDVQTREMYDTPEKMSHIASRIKVSKYSRLDNVKLDEKMLGRWVTNAKHG